AFVPLFVAHDGPLVVDAHAGVEPFAFLEVADGEVCREGAHRQPTSGPQRPCHAVQDRFVVAGCRRQAERALAQGDHRVELAVISEVARVATVNRAFGGASVAANVMKASEMSTPTTS